MNKFAIVALLSLSGCSTATASRDIGYAADFSAKVQAACATAAPLAALATPLPVAGPFIAAGVTVGCKTNDGFAKLIADPSSVEWLTQQAQLLRDALGRA